MEICIICSGVDFLAGYGNRKSITGKLPTCATCGAVERHRVIRGVYNSLSSFTKNMSVLQFAPDNSLNPIFFKKLDFSVYGGENSLDLNDIKLPDSSYDLIVSNHVLEHVKDPILAIKEMLRVVGDFGFVHICIPSPTLNYSTRDWGYPDPANAYHYRWYGADAGKIFSAISNSLHVIAVTGRDSITDTYEIIYFISRNENSLKNLGKQLILNNYPVVLIS